MATDDIEELRQKIAAIEVENQRYEAAIDDLHRLIIQMATDFHELHQMVRVTENRMERSATQMNVIGRTLAGLLARVEKLERSGGDAPDRS